MAPATHGGNRAAIARRLGCRPSQLLDLSASLAPFAPPLRLRLPLLRALLGGEGSPLRDYPDRAFTALRGTIARLHAVEPEQVLPGNGAAELFTWAARDAAAVGTSLLPTPGFADYGRALACWGGRWRPWPLPLRWGERFPAPFPLEVPSGLEPVALWLTNPHNPTGQLWSRASLEPLLERAGLLIVDEAFLPLCPRGEEDSLLPLVARHPNLVVIRSLTKLYGLAGLRLAYAVAHPERLRHWSRWRDPWPLNGLAVAAGEALLADPAAHGRWCARVGDWVRREGAALAGGVAAVPGLVPLPSAANFLLVRGQTSTGPHSLEPLRLVLERRHRILARDCRSFPGLDGSWLRLALSDRRGRQRLLRALAREGAFPQPPD
ncbi:MAG: aminotransferase class I/II-fold pyridoxal phosphate-dependent enzyme [Cyanobacteria bacterium K_Offshore_surface_m2_239]|nr:aminotransferase class I/II-fold pyridoxal phosphate-dependent enzyme [Cyanobacteria bacterium K_Offshore_surface_m2_239]